MADRLTQDQWHPMEAAHHARVDAATAAHRRRRESPRKHPVEDFLSSYYTYGPLRRRLIRACDTLLQAEAQS